MAKYDVFISYSRKDSKEVNALIDRLRRDIPSLKIWFDVDGIESAADFQSKIINAINESNTVIFVCSNNSLESEYCRKEIMYAKNKGKNVIPYLLPGMQLDGWLLFEFGTINCITSTKEDEVKRFIKDLKLWHGDTASDKESETHKENVKFTSSPTSTTQQSSSKTDTKSSNEGPLELTLEFDPTTGEFRSKNKRVVSLNEIAGRGTAAGHEYVDLGLPSGLKWATCNIGAELPEQDGFYFAWGEAETKSNYGAANSLTYKRPFDELIDKSENK